MRGISVTAMKENETMQSLVFKNDGMELITDENIREMVCILAKEYYDKDDEIDSYEVSILVMDEELMTDDPMEDLEEALVAMGTTEYYLSDVIKKAPLYQYILNYSEK